jgi:hypothetical protein
MYCILRLLLLVKDLNTLNHKNVVVPSWMAWMQSILYIAEVQVTNFSMGVNGCE